MAREWFAILQFCAVALMAAGIVIDARDPWSTSCFGGLLYFAAVGAWFVSIVPAAFALKGRKALLVVGVVLVEIVASFWVEGYLYARFVGSQREVLQLANPAVTVADARRVIESSQGQSMSLADLPPSLRIPHLRYAYVHEDHLDLVTYRNPEISTGFRIWSASAKRRQADPPTKYQDIFIYRYSSDGEEAPDNIP